MIGVLEKVRALGARIGATASTLDTLVRQIERLHYVEHAARLRALEEVTVEAAMPSQYVHGGRRSAWVVRVPIGGKASFKFRADAAGQVQLVVQGLYINARVRVAGCDLTSFNGSWSFQVESGHMVELTLESVVECPPQESRL